MRRGLGNSAETEASWIGNIYNTLYCGIKLHKILLLHLCSQCLASCVVTCISEVCVCVQAFFLDQDSNFVFCWLFFFSQTTSFLILLLILFHSCYIKTEWLVLYKL